MLSPADKARALELCKKLPKDLHVLCPDRSVQVKTWMIFFEMHDFIEMWDSIGQFTEEVFETRHAKRNELKRRFACIRSTEKREESMSIAFASCMNSRPARDDVIARTKR
jgi:hypothetical protein